MSSASPFSPPRSEQTPRPRHRAVVGGVAAAELFAIGWESISGLLFAAAVSPAVVARPWPTIIFTGSLLLSALFAPWFARGTRARFWALDVSRALAWALALLPVVELTGRGA